MAVGRGLARLNEIDLASLENVFAGKRLLRHELRQQMSFLNCTLCISRIPGEYSIYGLLMSSDWRSRTTHERLIIYPVCHELGDVPILHGW